MKGKKGHVSEKKKLESGTRYIRTTTLSPAAVHKYARANDRVCVRRRRNLIKSRAAGADISRGARHDLVSFRATPEILCVGRIREFILPLLGVVEASFRSYNVESWMRLTGL